MNSPEHTHLTASEIQAKVKSLERHMAMYALSQFQEFADRHSIDLEDHDMTPAQEEEWNEIRAKIDAHIATRKDALNSLIPRNQAADQ